MTIATHELSSTHKFRAFGLSHSSDLEFGDVWPCLSPADVRIRLVDRLPVETALPHRNISSPCRISVPDVVLLCVVGGAEILVHAMSPVPSVLLESYVLGPAMGALLHQRGDWPVHGSAILTPRGAVIFSGPSGSGKSTLAAALAQRGYPILADDLCAISWGTPPQISPGRPCIMLRENAIGRLGIETTSMARSVQASVRKLVVPLDPPCPEMTVPVHSFYFLRQTPDLSGFAVSSILGTRKVMTLASATYRKGVVLDHANAAWHLRQIMDFADVVRVSAIESRTDMSVLPQLCDYLEADFAKYPLPSERRLPFSAKG